MYLEILILLIRPIPKFFGIGGNVSTGNGLLRRLNKLYRGLIDSEHKIKLSLLFFGNVSMENSNLPP
jgi:hypothetical protein